MSVSNSNVMRLSNAWLSSSSAAQWSDPLACGHCGDQCQCTRSNVTQCDGYTTYHHLHLHLDTRQYLACICGSRMVRYKHLAPHALTHTTTPQILNMTLNIGPTLQHCSTAALQHCSINCSARSRDHRSGDLKVI